MGLGAGIPFPIKASWLVSGTLSPDATGSYYPDGEYMGVESFKRSPGDFYMFTVDAHTNSYVAAVKGDVEHAFWHKSGGWAGVYTPESPATGALTAAAP